MENEYIENKQGNLYNLSIYLGKGVRQVQYNHYI